MVSLHESRRTVSLHEKHSGTSLVRALVGLGKTELSKEVTVVLGLTPHSLCYVNINWDRARVTLMAR